MDSNCTIEANAEIAGIGIRTSIYVQALLGFILAGFALFRYAIEHDVASVGTHSRDLENVNVNDVKPTRDEIEYLFRSDIPTNEVFRRLQRRYFRDEKEDSRDLRQARMSVQLTGGALLIAAIIQSHLYGLDIYHALVVLNLCWLNNVTALTLYLTEQFLRHPFLPGFFTLKGLRDANPFLPTSAYMCGLGGFGIWLFIHDRYFGNDYASECNPFVLYWILGHPISVTASGFRIVGILIHAVACVPVLNLVVEIIIMCWGAIGAQFVVFWPARLAQRFAGREFSIEQRVVAPDYQNIHFLRTIVALAVTYCFFVIVFILDTEETIQANADHVGPGEGDWTFGQTLVMVLLLPLLWEMLEKTIEIVGLLKEKKNEDRKVEQAVMGLRREREQMKEQEGNGTSADGGENNHSEKKDGVSTARRVENSHSQTMP